MGPREEHDGLVFPKEGFQFPWFRNTREASVAGLLVALAIECNIQVFFGIDETVVIGREASLGEAVAKGIILSVGESFRF